MTSRFPNARENQVQGKPLLVAHTLTGAGTAVAMPGGARYMRVQALTAAVWWKADDQNTVAATAPAGATDNSPSYVPPQGSDEIYVVGLTHYAVASTGPVVVTFWN